MGAPQLISVREFMDHLKAEGLVIVKGDELSGVREGELRRLRREYMKKKQLTYKEVLDAQLLPVTTKQGITSLIERGVIKANEVGCMKNKTRFILTCAIVRLGYTD